MHDFSALVSELLRVVSFLFDGTLSRLQRVAAHGF